MNNQTTAFLHIGLAAILIAGVFSCNSLTKKDNQVQIDPDCSATYNSNNFQATTVTAFYQAGSGNIPASIIMSAKDGSGTSGRVIGVTFYNPIPTGSYQLGTDYWSSSNAFGIGSYSPGTSGTDAYGTTESPYTGTASITDVNTAVTPVTISGTFNFKAINPLTNATVTVSNGSFHNVPVTDYNSSGGGGGTTTTTGQATFWCNSDLGCGNITVTCNGQTSTISKYFSATPSCGTSGCASFTLNPGTYPFTAKCSSKNWNGNITVTKNTCATMRLY
jgi:hypothetical protein